jgi:CDP-diacylglycerol--glycerol-3-phosphate 3-phosphatidyltransferase
MVLFGLITWKFYAASFVVFVVAASTDWLDGYFARKYGLVTRLGRILDPFVDKIIICGTFICLVADPASGIQGWMAVIVVGRELLITALRSFLEQQGADFSASMSGKLKMVLQCLAAGTSLFSLAGWASTEAGSPVWLDYLLVISVWGAILLTVYSGIEYVRRAVALWRE